MAKDSDSQKIGRRGHSAIRRVFEDLGYICNDIFEDFGEDFFVYGEEDGIVEPFKIFVQAKSSEAWDKYASDWTEYCDPWTARNWILSNELTVVVRTNFRSGETRYAIPENECEYWSIDYEKDFPVRMLAPFDEKVAEKLIWIARIRHYDRLFRLTVPNKFELRQYQDVPRFKAFLFEFLVRLRIFATPPSFTKEFINQYVEIFRENERSLMLTPSSDMTKHEKIRYATCFRVIALAIARRAGFTIDVPTYFLDQIACLLVQFIIEAEETNSLPSVR